MKRRALLATAAATAALALGRTVWRRMRGVHPRFAYLGQRTTTTALESDIADGFVVVTTEGSAGRLVGAYRAPASDTDVLVVHFPGNSHAALVEATAQLSFLLADTPHGAVCFAPAGFDASEGVASLAALEHDAVAVLAYLKREHPTRALVLSSFSLGTLPALVARARMPTSVPAVLFAPFSTIEVGHIGPFGRVWDADVFSAAPLVHRPGGPITFVHGGSDELFSSSMVDALKALADKHEPELTSHVTLEGVRHVDIPMQEEARASLRTALLRARASSPTRLGGPDSGKEMPP